LFAIIEDQDEGEIKKRLKFFHIDLGNGKIRGLTVEPYGHKSTDIRKSMQQSIRSAMYLQTKGSNPDTVIARGAVWLLGFIRW
jgi:hypothetical protein